MLNNFFKVISNRAPFRLFSCSDSIDYSGEFDICQLQLIASSEKYLYFDRGPFSKSFVVSFASKLEFVSHTIQQLNGLLQRHKISLRRAPVLA